VCVCVCVFVCVCIHIYIHTFVYTHTDTQTHTHTRTHVDDDTSLTSKLARQNSASTIHDPVCDRARAGVCVCVSVSVCTRVRTRTRTQPPFNRKQINIQNCALAHTEVLLSHTHPHILNLSLIHTHTRSLPHARTIARILSLSSFSRSLAPRTYERERDHRFASLAPLSV
jgi:hypothetical protein